MNACSLRRNLSLMLLAMAPVTNAMAGTYTGATVSANVSVANNCTISTSGINFGNYDPIGTQRTNALTATGQVSIACVKGSSPTIGLNLGQNASGSQRRLVKSAPGDYLLYELYQPNSGTSCNFGGSFTVWGTTGLELFQPGSPSTKAARNYSICGKVAAGQDPSVGTYSDSVTATVNF